jgi:hypothetical protein
VEEPVLTSALATFVGVEEIEVIGEEEEEEEEEEEDQPEEDEEEQKEEQDIVEAISESLETKMEEDEIKMLRGVWSNLVSTINSMQEEDDNATQPDEEEYVPEEEEEEEYDEEEEEEDEEAHELEDEEEVEYEVDALAVASRWLRYRFDEPEKVLPFLIRDIIASDQFLFEWVQEMYVWGLSMRLTYSDGTVKHICLDENGLNSSTEMRSSTKVKEE